MNRCGRQVDFMSILMRAMEARYEVTDLTQSKGQEWPAPLVFSDISFCWKTPSFHMILGPSGGGKSTLLKTLGGVWRPTKGNVLIDGEPLWQPNTLTPNSLCASRIGYAFQNNALFSSMRVIENLTYPLLVRERVSSPTQANELAMSWLQTMGLESSAWLHPQEMSGGMQKRLAIARALVLEPEILFLDDPTAGLDPVTSASLMALVMDLLSKKSGLVVMVTNDIDRAKESPADKHYLVDGKLFSKGDENFEKFAERFGK